MKIEFKKSEVKALVKFLKHQDSPNFEVQSTYNKLCNALDEEAAKEPKLYIISDKKQKYFWKAPGYGTTCDLNQAHKYTKEQIKKSVYFTTDDGVLFTRVSKLF